MNLSKQVALSLKSKFKFLVITLFFISFFNHSKESGVLPSIKLLTGLPKPPYILNDGQTGLQLDIISKAFNCNNQQAVFINMPIGRNITRLKTSEALGIITVAPDFKYPGLHVSHPYIVYQNVVITLAENNTKIDSVDDLSMLSVGAFQTAKKMLGDDYAKAVGIGIEYREIADQNKQIKMLFERSVEAIVLDLAILEYFIKLNKDDIYQQKIKIHYIFDKRLYSAGFKSKRLKDSFERGLACIKENGSYASTVDSYND